MRKRIRLHQVRVGMFIEEMEGSPRPLPRYSGRFLVTSAADIDRMLRSHVMSVIIDTRKGLDVDRDTRPPNVFDPARFETQLKTRFTAAEIALARKTIEETKPHIRSVLSRAQMERVFNLDAATKAVEQVMLETTTNAGALIGIAKLKRMDEETFLHSLAVSALMITFGRTLGLDDDTIRHLGLGGLVHDLGKMALPVTLLRKAGQLSSAEFAIIRTHPERGHQLLANTAGMPPQVLDICLYHHEKFDGSGYPRGLAGEHIPYAARIASICDVYDALTSVRPYKRAFSQAEATDVMLRSRNQFDPELLRTFVSEMIISGALW